MALLPILRYPDPRLHTVAKPVLAVDARVRALVADMLETMYDAPGIGLAAIDDLANGNNGKRKHCLPLTPQRQKEGGEDGPAAWLRSPRR